MYDTLCILYVLLNKQVTCFTPTDWLAFDHISVPDVWPLVLWQLLPSSAKLWHTGKYLVAFFDEWFVTLMNCDGCINHSVITLNGHTSFLQWHNSTFAV